MVAAASSCVAFPTHIADDNPYGSQATEFIVSDKTSRTEVSSVLGAPVRIFSDGRWWVYHSERQMTSWSILYASTMGVGGIGFGGDTLIYSLLIEFDDTDVVKDLAVITDKQPCTNHERLCYGDGVLKVAKEPATSAPRYYSDESVNRHLNDAYLALRGDETDRFSATLNSGEQVELVEQGNLCFDAGSMQPFTGHVTLFDDDGAKRAERTYESGQLEGIETIWHPNGQKAFQAHYKDNLLHGPFLGWNQNGYFYYEVCFQDGVMVDLPMDECRS